MYKFISQRETPEGLLVLNTILKSCKNKIKSFSIFHIKQYCLDINYNRKSDY